jgi:cytochrome P450
MFSVYLLALHPEAQSRLHQELDQGREVLRKRVVPGAALSNGAHKVAAEPAGEPAANGNGHVNGVDSKAVKTGGSNEAGLNNEELAKHFPYTCAVIDEALRLFPPGASALRAPLEDIEVLGYR